MNLSAEQQAVVRAPLVRRMAVRAVAGSGKTAVLVERACFLIGRIQTPLPPKRLWFLSFTRAAEQELSSRLKAAKLPCRTLTLHRFALRELGDVRILEEHPKVWQEILGALQLRHTRLGPRIARELERLWQQPAQERTSDQQALLLDAERRIQAASQRDGTIYLTYTQVLAELLRVWEAQPQRLIDVQRQFDHLIVDEYQDVSPLQAQVIDTLAGDASLLVVGDPQQSIFSFQGSRPQVFDDFWETANRRFTLADNFRSPGAHLLAAGQLISDPLVPARGFLGSLEVYRSALETELMDALQREVASMVNVLEAGEIAVLVRENSHGEQVARLLREVGLSVRTTKQSRQKLSPWVREMLWPATAFLVGQRAGAHPLGWWRDCELDRAERALLRVAWQTGVGRREVQAVLSGHDRLFQLWEALEEVATSRELLAVLQHLTPPSAAELQEAAHLCHRYPVLRDLHTYLQGGASEEIVQVTVSTMHAAKGRQWPGVVIYEPYADAQTRADEQQMAEEWRLRYVALTRSTRDLVAILHTSAHSAYDQALSDEVVTDVALLERILSGDDVDTDDLEWLVLAAKRYAALQPYLDQYGNQQLPPGVRRAIGLMESGQQSPMTPVLRRPMV